MEDESFATRASFWAWTKAGERRKCAAGKLERFAMEGDDKHELVEVNDAHVERNHQLEVPSPGPARAPASRGRAGPRLGGARARKWPSRNPWTKPREKKNAGSQTSIKNEAGSETTTMPLKRSASTG